MGKAPFRSGIFSPPADARLNGAGKFMRLLRYKDFAPERGCNLCFPLPAKALDPVQAMSYSADNKPK
jgi:hypothetical protein